MRELLPPKPGSVEQEEYRERTAYGFQLEQLTKRVGELVSRGFCAAVTNDYEPPDACKVSRVEVENGPEIIRIDRT